ncbi:MAG TPA: ArsA family ATPase [Ruminiclostridium sp.]|nr:ArsA family ATPase [Ruminiclostridium sp.]
MVKEINSIMTPQGNTKYLFFGGKGGVGKTTMATATAVWFADLGYKTTIVSTDPTVSLSAIFGQEISGEKRTPIRHIPNLCGLNINPADAMGVYQRRLNTTLGEFNEAMGGDLVSTPCMEEMATFDQFVSFLETPDADVIVFDTAPTGKTLRELAMPFDWAGFLERQIQEGNKLAEFLPNSTDTAQEIERDKKRYDEAMSVLCNKDTTVFNLVLLPERLPIEETQSAIRGLSKLGIPIQSLIINQCILQQVIDGNSFLQARAKLQSVYLDEINARFKDILKTQIPLMDHDISDKESMRELGRLIFEDNSNDK